MKKIISTVAALGLVVGVAGTASALDFSISGKYVLEGYMLNGANGQDHTLAGMYDDEEGGPLDAYGNPTSDDIYDMVQELEDNGIITHAQAVDLNDALGDVHSKGFTSAATGGFDVYDDEASTDSAWVHTFVVNPQLKVNDKISMFSELRFAKDTDWGNDNNGGDTGLSSSDTFAEPGQSNIDVYLLYMEYLSPVGKVRAGRVATGSWGSDFISSASHGDRLMWWPSFVAEPFSLCLYTQKSQENDWYTSNSDSDSDSYEVDLTYKADNINLRVAYDYFNDKSKSDASNYYDAQYNRLKANANLKFGDFTVLGEWGWQFGDYRDYDKDYVAKDDLDQDAMALMLDASVKIDKLDVGMLYFWAEGQDDSDDEVTAAMNTLDKGIGDDFNPYYILTGDHTGMLNSDEYNADPMMVMSGVHSVGVHTDFQVTGELSLHGAIGYAWADSTDVLEYAIDDISDEYGWEVDLGAKYKLLDNLTYEVRAGYLNTGDFFDDIATAIGQESDDVYLLSHHLTMTF